jgi:hypothetical protein
MSRLHDYIGQASGPVIGSLSQKPPPAEAGRDSRVRDFILSFRHTNGAIGLHNLSTIWCLWLSLSLFQVLRARAVANAASNAA